MDAVVSKQEWKTCTESRKTKGGILGATALATNRRKMTEKIHFESAIWFEVVG